MNLPFSDDSLLSLPIILPLAAALLSFGYKRHPEIPALLGALLIFAADLTLASHYLSHGPLVHRIGGWSPVLGISLRTDWLSLLMLVLTGLIGICVSLYAGPYFSQTTEQPGQRTNIQNSFWPLWMMLWAGLNCLFLSGDLFNIYVSLEVVGLASVGLAALSGSPGSLIASLRYLLVSLLGSLSYLLGVGFLYKTNAVLDLASLSAILRPLPATRAALALITVGLLLKGALFPLHFWLPPAHAKAVAPVSALLSGLVIKAPWYLLFRFWFEIFPADTIAGAVPLFSLPAIGAIVWGSLQALRQENLKMLVAYSSVAQIGYFFLFFPIIFHAAAGPSRLAAIYYILSHGCAKAAMFLASGIFVLRLGHDRIAGLVGIHQQCPIAGFAFGMAGISLMGLPPSGGFLAKYQYLNLTAQQGHWGSAAMILIGSLLTAAYVYKAASHIFRPPGIGVSPPASLAPTAQWCAFFLALTAILLGFAGMPLARFMEVSP